MGDFVIKDGVLVGYTGNDEYVEIPEGVIEIEKRRSNEGVFFKNTEIKAVSFPNSLKKIGAFAFKQCTALEKVIFHGAPEMDSYVFEECSALEKIEIPYGVTRIASSLFAGCSSLREVIIPDTVTSIDPFAFQNCSTLKRITIPLAVDAGSVKSLFNRGFDKLRIEEITVAEENPYVKIENGLLLSKDGAVVHKCVWEEFEELCIPEGVRIIEPSAFAYCKGKRLVIAKSVTEMTDAFGTVAGVDTIEFEEGFETLPPKALSCFVSNLLLPKSLKLIRADAFKGLRKLKVLKLYDTYQYEPPKPNKNDDEIFVFSTLPNDPAFDPVERIEVYNSADELLVAIGLPCGKEAKKDLEYAHLVLHDYITGWNCFTRTFGKTLDHSALEIQNGDGFWYGYKKPESQDRFVYAVLPFLHLIAENSAATYLEYAQKRKKKLLAKILEEEGVPTLDIMIKKGILTASNVNALRKQAVAENKDAILAYFDTCE